MLICPFDIMMTSLIPISLRSLPQVTKRNIKNKLASKPVNGISLLKGDIIEGQNSYTFDNHSFIEADFEEDLADDTYPIKSYKKALKLRSMTYQYIDLYA